jgi:hypothetical protein
MPACWRRGDGRPFPRIAAMMLAELSPWKARLPVNIS